MNGVLEDFLRWFWISSAMTIFFGGVLFIATRRRELWLRYIAAEASFWTRIGVPAWIVDFSRRFEANRIFTGFLWLVAVSSFLLVLGNGAAYLYFKGKVPSVAQPEAAPGTDAAHAPRAG